MILKRQTTLYKEIKSDLKTGDIILMHGLYPSSHVIESFEGSLWSHSAIIVIAEDIGLNVGKDNILLWESNLDTPVKDVILKTTKSGPMLVKLSERFAYNIKHKDDSRFAIRHLYIKRTQEMFKSLKNVIKTVHSAKFPDTYNEMHDPMEGRFFNKQTSLKTIFCSELVAYTYMKLGLLTTIHPSNSYFPVDFSDKLSVGLLKRAWLGNEILLKVDE
ncbi:MAG: hypothetical protein GXO79_02135 [Chlorobi bacterium]|nr:hypothetical protein [Chlorobiota bacterium]